MYFTKKIKVILNREHNDAEIKDNNMLMLLMIRFILYFVSAKIIKIIIHAYYNVLNISLT